jgi:hypothetical protein
LTQCPSQGARGERGIWQRRFWEYLIRDDADDARHVEYATSIRSSTAWSSACATGRIRRFIATLRRVSSLAIERAILIRRATSASGEMSFVRRIGDNTAIRRNVWQDGGLRLRVQPALRARSGLRVIRVAGSASVSITAEREGGTDLPGGLAA